MKNNWKSGIKKYRWIPLYLILSILLGTVLMIFVYCLPIHRIRGHVQETSFIYTGEDDHPSWLPGYSSGILDYYTDSIMMREAIYSGSQSAVTKAMKNPYYVSADTGSQLGQLMESLDDTKVQSMSFNCYPRYWHGYLLFLKPLLEFFNVLEIRILSAIVQTFLFCLVSALLAKRLGTRIALAFGLSAAFLNPVSIILSFQYQSVYYTILLEFVIALLFKEKLEKGQGWMKLFFFSGVFTVFVDFLTYPFAALGMLLILYFVFYADSMKNNILALIRLSVSWIIGYAGMWAGKWLMATCITGENIFKDALNQAEERSVGGDVSGLGSGPFAGIRRAIEAVDGKMFVVVAFVLIVFALFAIGLKMYRIHLDRNRMLSLALVCLYPFVWYMVLWNHSVIHSWMTYRELVISVFGVLCMGAVSIVRTPGRFLKK
ncbi:MAG: hypothetical protein ACI4ET_00580 [Bilifractor sp.]